MFNTSKAKGKKLNISRVKIRQDKGKGLVVKYFLSKHENLSLILAPHKELDVAMCI